MTDSQIQEWFAYHDCSEQDVAAMTRWREGLSAVAADFAAYTPANGDVIVALRALKTAMMAMNAALVAPMPKDPPVVRQSPGAAPTV